MLSMNSQLPEIVHELGISHVEIDEINKIIESIKDNNE
jgi:hypothetical protein